MLRFMVRHLTMVSCDPFAPSTEGPRLDITSCPPGIAGGFSPNIDDFRDSGITICANGILSKNHLEDTLAHEMIHWWDNCRFKVDWTDLRQHACSEIRAASLSGDCGLRRELDRAVFGFTKQHQTCARRRAVLSIMNDESCPGGKEQAEKVVDEIWASCFKDTRPFDEVRICVLSCMSMAWESWVADMLCDRLTKQIY